MGYKVKIQETNRGQKIINIPKVISLFNIKKGMECEWLLDKSGDLVVKIIKEQDKMAK